MAGLIYYAVDTETTGVTKAHEITEISIIRDSDKPPYSQYSAFIKPAYPERASFVALEKTGRVQSDLYKGRPAIEVIQEVDDWIAQDGAPSPEYRCFIGHQISFDRRFLFQTWAAHNKVFPAGVWLDTMKMARLWAKKLGIQPDSFTLTSVMEFAGIKPAKGNAHTASKDVQDCFMIYKRGMKMKLDHLECIKRELQ